MDKSKWEYKKLGEVCQFSSQRFEVDKLSKDNYIGVDNLLKDCCGKISASSLDKVSSAIAYNPDDILIGNIRPYLKKIWLADSIGGASGDVLVLQTKDTYKGFLYPRFLYYALANDYFFEYDYQHSKGVKMPRGDKKEILKYSIPIPSINLQQNMATTLDQLSDIISLKQQQIKEYDALAQSLFYEMFGDPLVNNKGWEVSTYGKEYFISSGGTPSKAVKEYWENGNIPWIGSNMCQNCILYETDGKFITKDGLQHSSTRVLPKGSILIALVGATIGKVALLECETSINQNVAYVLNDDKFDSYYLYYHTMGLYKLFSNVGNGKFKMANQKFVKSLPVMLPPLSLQHSFAEKVQTIEHQKSLLKQSIAETQMLLDSRMQEYFG